VTLGALLQGIEIKAARTRAAIGLESLFQRPDRCQPRDRIFTARRCWLIWKTSGPVHDDARAFAKAIDLGNAGSDRRGQHLHAFLSDKYYEIWFTMARHRLHCLMPLVVR